MPAHRLTKLFYSKSLLDRFEAEIVSTRSDETWRSILAFSIAGSFRSWIAIYWLHRERGKKSSRTVLGGGHGKELEVGSSVIVGARL
jgi:hypothetical protein